MLETKANDMSCEEAFLGSKKIDRIDNSDDSCHTWYNKMITELKTCIFLCKLPIVSHSNLYCWVYLKNTSVVVAIH